jgi:hypothetical protein
MYLLRISLTTDGHRQAPIEGDVARFDLLTTSSASLMLRHQCAPYVYVGIGQPELPRDLRWLNTSPEGSTHGIELPGR